MQSKQVYNALPHYRKMSAWGDKITLWMAAHRLRLHIDVYHGGYRYQIDPTRQLAKQQSIPSSPHKRRVALQLHKHHYQTLLQTVDTNPAIHEEPIVMGTSLQGGAGDMLDYPTRNPRTPDRLGEPEVRADQPNPEDQQLPPDEDEDAPLCSQVRAMKVVSQKHSMRVMQQMSKQTTMSYMLLTSMMRPPLWSRFSVSDIRGRMHSHKIPSDGGFGCKQDLRETSLGELRGSYISHKRGYAF